MDLKPPKMCARAPGGEELDELVGLVLRLAGRVVQVGQVVGGDQGQVAHAARRAAPTQADGGGGGGGAQARVGHRGRLPLPQEVRPTWGEESR